MPSLILRPAPSSAPIVPTEGGAWTEQLQLLLESTGEGIFGVDMFGCCNFVNSAAAEMLGYATDAVLGRNMHELIHHTHADGIPYPEADCPIFNAFRRGLPCRIDNEVLWRADGSAFSAEYSSHPILDGGVVQGAVVTMRDITERKRSELLLQQSHEQLERRVAERTAELTQALGALRELSAYSESVREEERTRIAREIHDELGSLLVALKMDVGWVEKRVQDRPELSGKCLGMGRTIDTAVDNLGRIITDLRPSILDHQGLWAALEWQAQEFIETTELRADLQVSTPDDPFEAFYFATIGGEYALFARKDNGGGPIVYDLSSPFAPTFAGTFVSEDGDGGYAFRHGDLIFQGESEFGAIYDFASPDAITERLRVQLPGDFDTLTPLGNVMVASVDEDGAPGQATAIMPWAEQPDADPPALRLHRPADGATFVKPGRSRMAGAMSVWQKTSQPASTELVPKAGPGARMDVICSACAACRLLATCDTNAGPW
jgi:PAS domain S-box-containing protein